MYQPETSLGYIGWEMIPFYANLKKFDGSGNEDPEQVTNEHEERIDKAFNEPTQEQVLKLFDDKPLHKDYELLDKVNGGVFVL